MSAAQIVAVAITNGPNALDGFDVLVIFFFQAEDGIRCHCVTGVQTCALPIYPGEIDLLRTRERKQEIERPLEALDVDDQGLGSGRPMTVAFRLRPIGEVAVFCSVVHSSSIALMSSPP